MRPERAKALNVLLLSMLLPLQGDHHPHEITQGVASLCPGLCASAPSGRAGLLLLAYTRVKRSDTLMLGM